MSVPTFVAGLMVGLIPFLIAGWLWQRHRTQLLSEMSQLETEHQNQANHFTTTLETRHRQERALEAQYEQDAKELSDALNDAYQAQIDKLKDEHKDELDFAREYLARGIQWEEISRRKLAEACHSLGVNGFLATNVCFLAQNGKGQTYIHQIDHLVVAEDMLFVIEAKNWEGNIYHRKGHTRSSNPFLVDTLPVLQEAAKRERFVFVMKKEGDMFCLPDGNTREPVAQVQAQSMSFRDFLTSQLGKHPGETYNMVFYSHPKSKLMGGAMALSQYTWVTDNEELTRVLDQLRELREAKNQPPVDVHGLYHVVSALGADVMGLGSFADTWESPLPYDWKSPHSSNHQSKTSAE